MPTRRLTRILVLLAAVLHGIAQAGHAGEPVQFNRDVRSILSNSCFACHGFDAGSRKAGLRLDLREHATEQLPSGHRAIVPGDSSASELIRRVSSKDQGDIMPPPDHGHQPLTEAQIETLRRWIDQGAVYEDHWSFTRLTRPEVPVVRDTARVANPIDNFVVARLHREGLTQSPRADRITLLRRVSLDLTGLPPTIDEVRAFLSDESDNAYERVVDRLLASPRYGERMAMHWLDLVRYADTVGYHGDVEVSIWPYRDYVIRAFNDNLPFDQFTREQLAGDLLPEPTVWQKIATGYNRLNQTTEEGGSQEKEYLAIYAADRVRNVSTVWMGLTVGCAECHDHKFDPVTIREFYQLAAFFADIEQVGVYAIGKGRPPVMPVALGEDEEHLEAIDNRIAEFQKELEAQLEVETPERLEVLRAWEASMRDALGRGTVAASAIPVGVVEALFIAPSYRTHEQRRALRSYFYIHTPEGAPMRQPLEAARAERDRLLQSLPTTLVTHSVQPRITRVLPRGNWMDESGEVVDPGVPAFLPPLKRSSGRATRLDLAEWLVRRDNPLTSRVVVNRFWQMFFARGLSGVPDDLGAQGEWPSHPQLLDWLAVEFIESGWDVKHIIRTIVLSETYQQSSMPRRELRDRDPGNRLLARQARFRVAAETVRDNALAISGLLVHQLGGRSVKPYQPAGYYAELNWPQREYEEDTGDNLYRRGLYTHWQRTFLHPMLKAFDAPSREECTARRDVSNTPLAALTLLNDPTFVEAARVFAQRMMREAGPGEADRIIWAYERTLSRPPRDEELHTLCQLYAEHLEHYRSDQAAAVELINVGEAPVPSDLDPATLAAWTSVARVLLNLHETIVRY